MSTLHIASGDEQVTRLSVEAHETCAVWREALADGPVCQGSHETLFALRRAFATQAYAAKEGEYEQKVLPCYLALCDASHTHIILHFDTDLFCVINALFCVSAIGCAQHITWRVLGQSIDLSILECAYIRSCWQAYTSEDTRVLEDLASNYPPRLSFVASALRAHLERFPSTTSHLGTPQQLIVDLFERGLHETAGIVSAFTAMDNNRYGWGNLQIIREMELAKTLLAGRDVLMTIGGVHVQTGLPHWQWNPTLRSLQWSDPTVL